MFCCGRLVVQRQLPQELRVAPPAERLQPRAADTQHWLPTAAELHHLQKHKRKNKTKNILKKDIFVKNKVLQTARNSNAKYLLNINIYIYMYMYPYLTNLSR